MRKCSKCLHLCLNGSCSLHTTLKEECSDFEPRNFELFEHLCSYCKNLSSCKLGSAIQEGDLDQVVKKILKVKGELELRIVIPACKSFTSSY